MVELVEEIKKFNPYHGSDGRFTTGAAATSFTFRTKNPAKQSLADHAVAREKKRYAASEAARKSSAISKCKDYRELTIAAREVCGFRNGFSPSVKKKIGLDAAKAAMEGFGSVAQQFPEIKSYLDKVVICRRRDACAQTNGNTLELNPEDWGTLKQAAAAAKIESTDNLFGSGKQRWWVKNATPQSTIAHEAGHCVESAIIIAHGHTGVDEVNMWNAHTYANQIVDTAVKHVQQTPEGRGKDATAILMELSRQSVEKGYKEAFPESFADVNANGDNATPVAKEVVRLAREELDKAYRPKYMSDNS